MHSLFLQFLRWRWEAPHKFLRHNTNFFRSSNSFDEALKHTETWNKCGYNKQTQLCCLTYSTCTNPTLKIFIFRMDFSRFVFLFEKIFTFFCFLSVKEAKQRKEQVANGSHSPQPSHFLRVVNVVERPRHQSLVLTWSNANPLRKPSGTQTVTLSGGKSLMTHFIFNWSTEVSRAHISKCTLCACFVTQK